MKILISTKIYIQSNVLMIIVPPKSSYTKLKIYIYFVLDKVMLWNWLETHEVYKKWIHILLIETLVHCSSIELVVHNYS